MKLYRKIVKEPVNVEAGVLIYLLASNFFSSLESFLEFINAKNPRIAKNPITQISVMPIFKKVPFPGY
jgi:hypothetical protein